MKKIYHLNDKTMKYKTMAQTRLQHKYLGLPGEFEMRYPQEIVFPNMESGRADEFYSTKEGWLIDLEEESEDVGEKTLKKISNYAIFGDFIYSKKMYIVVICRKNPKNYPKFYERSPSIYIKVHYYYIPQEELWKKYDNIINKVEQKEELTDMESLDIVFISKFISKEYAQEVTESLSKVFKNAIIKDKKLKRDVGILLGGMILKHFDDENEINRLMEMINMKKFNDEIEAIVYDEIGDKIDELEELNKSNKELNQSNKKLNKTNKKLNKTNKKLNQSNKEYKKGIEELSKLEDLSPKAKEIINTLILMK